MSTVVLKYGITLIIASLISYFVYSEISDEQNKKVQNLIGNEEASKISKLLCFFPYTKETVKYFSIFGIAIGLILVLSYLTYWYL